MEIAWLGNWSGVLVGVVETLVVVIASYLVLKIARRQIRDVGERAKLPPELVSLFDSVIKFAICFVAFYLILVIWDVTSIIMPLIAGASVLALAIGLASKDIISNAISGIFILLDKPFKIGSIIEVRGVKGEVIEIGLRVTKIRTEEGAIATIPNTILSSDIVKKRKDQ
ncbi:MAG: mechanosensitive ion channel [Methanocellales archaeon]|nr:mechanosensitive ion channel [Methanocellales archaeon]